MMKAFTLVPCLAACLATQAVAQDYPSRPIRIIVPFVAGAGGDLAARLVTVALSESLGQPLVVENRAGAGESIGAGMVAKSAPDGYTYLIGSSNGLVQRTLLTRNPPYDSLRDFTPITQIAKSTAAIVVNPSFPATSLGEVIAYAKAHPGKISFGTSGIGTSHHLGAEQIKQITGVEMVHVPYKSGIQPLNDVMAGLIPMSFVIMGTLIPQLKSGKVRPIAIISENRHPRAPDVPTVAETLPGFRIPPSFFAMVGPASLPPPILARISGEVMKAIKSPRVSEKLASVGFEPVGSSPEEFAKTLRDGMALSAAIIKSAGIQPTE